jgi:hypothetical protein
MCLEMLDICVCACSAQVATLFHLTHRKKIQPRVAIQNVIFVHEKGFRTSRPLQLASVKCKTEYECMHI